MLIRTDDYEYEKIPTPLLKWYDENKRDLPWRHNPTPYRVWVSEIMLQQTRVEAAKEYYLRFLKELPDVYALANCDEDKLMKLWEGLGYYSRARNLQKAAKQIVEKYDGVFPDDEKSLKELSGIGDYTVGAIRSIAFGKRAPAIDGNVFRVLSRLAMNGTDISNPKYKAYLFEKLIKVYPNEGERCSAFTQALMELGALICKPTSPDCINCPLQKICLANAQNAQENYPVLPEKRAKKVEKLYVFHIRYDDGIAVRKRESGVLKGMYELPSVIDEGQGYENALKTLGVTDYAFIKKKGFTHIFTHIKWEMTCVYIRAKNGGFERFTDEAIVEKISLPTAFRQCLIGKDDEV